MEHTILGKYDSAIGRNLGKRWSMTETLWRNNPGQQEVTVDKYNLELTPVFGDIKFRNWSSG